MFRFTVSSLEPHAVSRRYRGRDVHGLILHVSGANLGRSSVPFAWEDQQVPVSLLRAWKSRRCSQYAGGFVQFFRSNAWAMIGDDARCDCRLWGLSAHNNPWLENFNRRTVRNDVICLRSGIVTGRARTSINTCWGKSRSGQVACCFAVGSWSETPFPFIITWCFDLLWVWQ